MAAAQGIQGKQGGSPAPAPADDKAMAKGKDKDKGKGLHKDVARPEPSPTVGEATERQMSMSIRDGGNDAPSRQQSQKGSIRGR